METSNFSFFSGKKSKLKKEEMREQNLRLLRDSRLDVSRIQLIQFVKIFTRLTEKRQEMIYQRHQRSFPACDNFVRAIEEFLLLPPSQTLDDSDLLD